MGEEALDGNQLPRSGRSSTPVVRQIFEVFVNMASFHLQRCRDGCMRFSEPREKLLDICAIGQERQRALVQFAQKLV